MDVWEAIMKRRTVRRFKQEPIPQSILINLVNAARMAPSGANIQPLKYMIVDDPAKVIRVFEQVRWAAYLAPNGAPGENERPSAFLLILLDNTIKAATPELDAGAACQNIMLAAAAEGIGTCWMGAIKRERIREILDLPERYTLHTVIALGYAGEEPVAEDASDSIRYYKDPAGVLHVPKRTLKDILLPANGMQSAKSQPAKDE
ncbi:MAG TPA: nitroreductase [Clostridiales bacterium]|nr:nitroreductase [Clostridiales bacterium]